MTRCHSFLLPAILLASLTPRARSEDSEEPRIVGPVTDLSLARTRVYAACQAGLFATEIESARKNRPTTRRVHRPSFRAVAVCASISDAKLTRLLIVGGEPGKTGEAELIEIEGRSDVVRSLATRNIAKDLAYCAAIAPTGRSAAIGCADGRVLEVRLPSLETIEIRQRHTGPVRDVAYSPDGKLLASGGLDGLIFLKSLASDDPARVLQEHTAGVECLVFSSDSERLASGARDGKVRLHSRDGRLLRSIQAIGDTVLSLAWTKSDDTIWMGLADGRVTTIRSTENTTTERYRLEHSVNDIVRADDGDLVLATRGRIVQLRAQKPPDAER